MSQTIIPAIIPQSLEHLIESLERIESFATEVQIDIVDGVFVPPVSWPYIDGASPVSLKPIVDGFDVELDLMIEDPETVLETYLQAGATRVVIHLESTRQLQKIVELKNSYDFSLGLSILNDTPMDTLIEHISGADYVQLIGIGSIGSQGAPFDERVLERIKTVHDLYPNLLISVDGSVNASTLPRLKEAGANRFVVGSAIFNADSPADAYKALTQIAA